MFKKIDNVSLQEYESLAKGNKGFIKILLEKVIRKLDEFEPLILEDVEEHKLQELREHTHHIKPMLASLRLSKVLNLFEDIKNDYQNEAFDQELKQQRLSFIKESFTHAKTELRNILDG